MLRKNSLGSAEWTDPDDAPKLTPELLAEAEVFEADQFIRRGRGRPLSEFRKEKINVRLDPDVLERLRASGPGWQSKINKRLAMMTGTDLKLWEWLERHIESLEAEIPALEHEIASLQDGTLQTTFKGKNWNVQTLENTSRRLVNNREGIEISHQTQLDLFRQSGAPD